MNYNNKLVTKNHKVTVNSREKGKRRLTVRWILRKPAASAANGEEAA